MESFYDYNNMSSFNSIGKGIQQQITTSAPYIKTDQVDDSIVIIITTSTHVAIKDTHNLEQNIIRYINVTR